MRNVVPLGRRFRVVAGFGRLASAISMSAVLTGTAPASAAAPERGAMAACSVDLATFCPGTEAGGGKKMRCLADNQAKLSPECAASVKSRIDKRAARLGGTTAAQAQTPAANTPAASTPSAVVPPVGAPAPSAPLPAATPVTANMAECRTDMATLCASVAPGAGRKIKCLMDHQATLSPACSAAVSARGSQQQVAKGACAEDAVRVCGSVQGRARLQCLEANTAKLTPLCAAFVAKRSANLAKRAAAPPTPPKQ